MAPNHGGDSLGSILGPMGSHWVHHRKKFTIPPNSNFRLPRGHRFRPKFDFTVMAQNHGVDHLGSTLWPFGSHWVQKWVTTVKNYHHALKFDYATTPRSSISTKIRLYGYGANLGVNRIPLGPKIPAVFNFDQNSTLRLWRQKKWVTTVKNYDTPKFEFSTTPRSSISTKIRLYGYSAKSRCRPPRVHFVANGIPLGPKKWVNTVKNYHALKFDFSTTPRSSISTKIRLYGYGAKSRCRPPRVHFVANGVPLGPMNGSKP